ncbi:MAG: ArnT family glycosyltransferase [Deltaproteobacteria bacterium]
MSLINRFIQIDENWFGEQSFYLANEGVVKLKSMPGIYDNQNLIYHKLLILMGAVVVKIFGWSVFNFKLLTLSFFIIFLFVFNRYNRSYISGFTKSQSVIPLFFIFFAPVMIEHTFTFRPEIFVMTFGFLSYFFLINFLNRAEYKYVLLAGLFAGLAFFTTLNGILFILAGSILLVFHKKFKGLMLFLLLSTIAFAGFFWDLWQPGHWKLFQEQVKSGATSKLGEGILSMDIIDFIVFKITNLASEHQRFFWSERVQAFSLLFLIAFISKFKLLWKEYKNLTIYLLSLIVSLSLFSSHLAERYLIYYLPFMALIISIGIVKLKNSDSKYIFYIYSFVFIINLVFIVRQYVWIFSSNQQSALVHREMIGKLPEKNNKVFAPWSFIYNEIHNCDLMSYQAMQYYQDNEKKKFSRVECIDLLKNRFKVKYIILDNNISVEPENDYDWFRGIRMQGDSTLSLLYSDKNYLIYSIK